MPLALAYQVSAETQYADKLIEIADEMLRAQTDPDNNQKGKTLPPLQPDNYYATRYLGPVAAVIYDWCYDRLGADRQKKLIALMNTYFDDFRENGYEINDHATGNYYLGHMIAAGYMGFAIMGDNPRAQEMIDFARVRFDGKTSPLVKAENVPTDNFALGFAGGFPAGASSESTPITGAPLKSGFNPQSWAYGSESFARVIDYLLALRSATGEDLLTPHQDWFTQILRAQKHALLPNRFEIDPSGDWGGRQGAVILRMLPARLAYVLAGTPDGPGAQHFATSGIAESTYPDVEVYPLSEWEDFIFSDAARPAAELMLPPYYTGFGPVNPKAGPTNGAVPYFIQRSDWGPEATWVSTDLGCQYYDDHQHFDAGAMTIKRGNDYLLIDASNWKGEAGGHGIIGDSTEWDSAAAANTLYFDDFGEYMTDFRSEDGAQYAGGQGGWGKDEVIAAELADAYSYIRSDLSTAYNFNIFDEAAEKRRLASFYRSFVYLRAANLIVVYDQVAAKNSTNPRGQYRKHLRWHFPNKPSVNGKMVQVDQGASRLYLETVLPANAALNVVDESNNPDPCVPGDSSCKPYAKNQLDYLANTNTWRIEVSDPANPPVLPFLTVLRPGTKATPATKSSLITGSDTAVIGVRIDRPDGPTTVVVFNNQPGQVPPPLTTTTYPFSGPPDAVHTLCGVTPGTAYTVSFDGASVRVNQGGAGGAMASPAGVVQFKLQK